MDTQLFSFAPICDMLSRVLILGTMPSPASFRAGMYYSHPQNAFWRILSDLTGDDAGSTNEQKRLFLLRNHIALWDTLRSCIRPTASDNDIVQPEPNDIAGLLTKCPQIGAIFCNGSAAHGYFRKYQKEVSLPVFRLSSTSPANASMRYEQKREEWAQILNYMHYE